MNMKRNYVSFDVFDTCLIRRCGLPCKIWDLMADKLFEKDDSRGRLSFTGNRSLAEKKASVENPYPTLANIYEELNVSQWGLDPERTMNLEMEIEEQELFSNPEMMKTVNEYRERGFVIAFVSDMYLPTEFIKKILVKYGFCRDDEKIFVSGDCKASKYDGRLYDYLFKETGTKAKQWIHYGDNIRSDYRVPKSKGIKACHVTDTDFTDEEKRWLEEACFYSHKHEIELWAGLCRLSRLQNKKSFAATMAVDFIASVYVPYVIYVLKTAKAKGIKTLYFLARDAHIFLEIAKTLKNESEGIECRYLMVNRRVLYESIFYNVDQYELSLVIDNAHDQTVENCLKHIGLNWDKLSSNTRSEFPKNKRLNSKKRLNLFKEYLQHNDADLLKKHSIEKRALLIKYLEQEELFQQKSALVDLGWVGSCRCAINYILRNEGHDSVSNFYFGYHRALIYGNPNDLVYIFNKQIGVLYKSSCDNRFFEEYASINPRGSTIGYKINDGKVIPVEAENNMIAESLASINEKSLKSFCENLNCHSPLESDAFNEIFFLCGLNQLSNILSTPQKQHLAFFKKLAFENYSVEERMVRRLPLKDILALCVWGVPASMIWAEAAIKMTFGPFAETFTKLYKYTSKTAFANRLRLWWEKRA